MAFQFSPPAWNLDSARHLLARTEFSADESRVQSLAQMTIEGAVESILAQIHTAPQPSPPNWIVEPWVNTERRFSDTTPDEFREMHVSTDGHYSREIADLRRWWLQEMVSTQTPFREVKTLFCTDTSPRASARFLSRKRCFIKTKSTASTISETSEHYCAR